MDTPKTSRATQLASEMPQKSASPAGIRKNKRELLMGEIPPNMADYLRIVFPSVGDRPPVLHYTERNPDGFPTIYEPDPSDPVTISAGQHWVLFRSRSDLPDRYHTRVIKWLAYIIGIVVHHVAIRKFIRHCPHMTVLI